MLRFPHPGREELHSDLVDLIREHLDDPVTPHPPLPGSSLPEKVGVSDELLREFMSLLPVVLSALLEALKKNS